MRTVGVEEEFLLVDAHHGRTRPVATRVLRIAAARADAGGADAGKGSLVLELHEQQLEAFTAPHVSMPVLEADLRAQRSDAAAAAAEAGTLLVASATCPVAVEPRRVRTPRYDALAERFRVITDDALTCGCHVHVAVTSSEEAVAVLDRIRVWLPALLALSANSPFWQGLDTGYASFRSQVLCRWPMSGPTDVFGDEASHDALVEGMLASEVILDEGMLYYDARRSHRWPTVEIRVPDVCADVRDAVLMAALCRALVETSAKEWASGLAPPPVPTPLLRLATWQAARWGISERLLDPLTSRPRPASDVIGALLDHVDDDLRRTGDRALVIDAVERILGRGNGATRQREVHDKTGHLGEVIAALATATMT